MAGPKEVVRRAFLITIEAKKDQLFQSGILKNEHGPTSTNIYHILETFSTLRESAFMC